MEKIRTAAEFLKAWGLRTEPWARMGLLYALEINRLGVDIESYNEQLRALMPVIRALMTAEKVIGWYEIEPLILRALRAAMKHSYNKHSQLWFAIPKVDRQIMATLCNDRIRKCAELHLEPIKREVTAYLSLYYKYTKRQAERQKGEGAAVPVSEWWFKAVIATCNAELLTELTPLDDRAARVVKQHLQHCGCEERKPTLTYFLEAGGQEAILANYLSRWAIRGHTVDILQT
jgi:hypothetical protein